MLLHGNSACCRTCPAFLPEHCPQPGHNHLARTPRALRAARKLLCSPRAASLRGRGCVLTGEALVATGSASAAGAGADSHSPPLPGCHGGQRGWAQGSKAPADWLRGRSQSAGGVFRRCQDGGQVNTAGGSSGTGVAAEGGAGCSAAPSGFAGAGEAGESVRVPPSRLGAASLRFARSGLPAPPRPAAVSEPALLSVLLAGLTRTRPCPPGGRRRGQVVSLPWDAVVWKGWTCCPAARGGGRGRLLQYRP